MLFFADSVNSVDARSRQCDGVLFTLGINRWFCLRETLAVFVVLANARVYGVTAAFATNAHWSGSVVTAKFITIA